MGYTFIRVDKYKYIFEINYQSYDIGTFTSDDGWYTLLSFLTD